MNFSLSCRYFTSSMDPMGNSSHALSYMDPFDDSCYLVVANQLSQ